MLTFYNPFTRRLPHRFDCWLAWQLIKEWRYRGDGVTIHSTSVYMADGTYFCVPA